MKTCGRCDEEYEGYTFLVTDDLPAIVRVQKIEEKFDQVCQSCRSEIENDELYEGWEDPRK